VPRVRKTAVSSVSKVAGYSKRNIFFIVAQSPRPSIDRPVSTQAAAIGRDFALGLIENYRLGKLDTIGKMKIGRTFLVEARPLLIHLDMIVKKRKKNPPA
jgi:hypothetical protein